MPDRFVPGRARQRVTVESRSITRDSFGQDSESWSEVATIWAEVIPLTGRELAIAQQLRADVTHKVLARYMPSLVAIDPEARIRFRGRVLAIQAVIDVDERRRDLSILCREVLTPP